MALMLIVTDEPDTLLELRHLLGTSGHTTVLAADADTALKRLSASIELVVLDIMMPVRDGWTVLEAIREQPQPPPVIVVSRRAGPLDLARARRMGALGALAAPVSGDQLNQAVTDALAGSFRGAG